MIGEFVNTLIYEPTYSSVRHQVLAHTTDARIVDISNKTSLCGLDKVKFGANWTERGQSM